MSNTKVAIITGSTSGIGLGIATKLGQAGYHIILNGLGDPTAIEDLRSKMEKDLNIKVGYSSADMSSPRQIRHLIHSVQKEWGSVDIIVNNAGIQFTSPIESFPAEKWESILSINLSAAFYMIQAALPNMQEQGWGRIINIASVHGLVGSLHKAAYVAAKHGLLGLTKVVALENATKNITCNAICPGWVHTPLVKKQIEDRALLSQHTIEEETINLLKEKQPSHRFARTEDIGELIVFLCSEAADAMTGAILTMDGGWTAQ